MILRSNNIPITFVLRCTLDIIFTCEYPHSNLGELVTDVCFLSELSAEGIDDVVSGLGDAFTQYRGNFL